VCLKNGGPGKKLVRSMAKISQGKDIFIAAHPDDTEVLFGYRLSQSKNPWVLIVSDGRASTIDLNGNGFVEEGGRRQESQRGLEYYGLPLSQQCYLDLPDGELDKEKYATQTRDTILEMIGSCGLHSLVTFGSDGFDGHTDHQAMYHATLAAAAVYNGSGDVFTLDSSHKGLYVANGVIAQKLGAMAAHESQFDLDSPVFWNEFAPYVPLITQGETYNRVSVAAHQVERYAA
jgi:LmbE family N-acetylglucosaminyl deacetylase